MEDLHHLHTPASTRYNSPFHSFWMAGYECTDQLNAHGNRVDLIRVTGHLQQLEEDYRLLSPFHIRTVREGIRWSQVERQPYQYDWSTVAAMIEAGKAQGIQQVWDICHFGFPDDLSPLHPHFPARFAALCRSFVRFYRAHCPDGPLIVTPVNEVSFFSWLGGEVGGTAPYAVRLGWEVKYHLMKAYILGVKAMREEDTRVRILTTEPLVQIVAPPNATMEQIEETEHVHNLQYQAMDMLCGRICPELGGSPECLDILGFNFYYNNQWELGYRYMLSWANIPADLRWKPLRHLMKEAYLRYRKPIALTETSHPQEDRPHWIRYIGEECAAVLGEGIPLLGVCLYPIIDRPDWDNHDHWHQAGLWDALHEPGGNPGRILYEPYAEALLEAQDMVSEALREAVAGPKPKAVMPHFV